MHFKTTRILGISAALAATAFAVGLGDAEASGAAKRRGRRAHFKSQPAPARAKTPAIGADGTTDDTSRAPVAGAALEGGFRQDLVSGGALLAMGPGRALVLNSYQGLTLVDTTDPSSPRALASVAVKGTGQRMLLGTDEVAVISDAYDVGGTRTIVTSVAVGDASLTVAGSVDVKGSLADASRKGDDLLLVTRDGYYGPIVYMDAAGGLANGFVPPPSGQGGPSGGPAGNHFKRGTKSADGGIRAPDGGPWWGGSQSAVARVRIAADGVPTLLGTLDVDGTIVADAISGTDAVLALQANDVWTFDPMPGQDPNAAFVWNPYGLSLMHVVDDAAGAPKSTGTLALDGAWGVYALDIAGSTLRALESTDVGESVVTFDLAGGAPVAQGSIALGTWPSSFAFAGGSFVYATTAWEYGGELPDDPVFDPNGVENAFGTKSGGPASAAGDGPTSALHVVDLRDPAHPAAGGSIDLGGGWIGGLVAVQDGVVGSRFDYDSKDGSTTVFRAYTADPAVPILAGSVTASGYANVGAPLGDLVLLDGGSSAPDGSFRPFTQILDLAGGGIALGGSFSVGSWTTSAAREGDLLGLASYDRVTFVDVGDRAHPQVKGDVRLLVNVAGFAALGDTTGAVLATDYLGGAVEIRTVSLPAADALVPLDVLEVARGDAQMFASAPFLYVVTTDWSTGRASVHVVDASDPAHLVARGSLDLASYPGQVFQKGKTLLLLREAYSLFQTAANGKRKAAADAFGRCPKSWLRDELSAVLDVVDLSDPDAPSAAERLRMRWDYAGTAILDGDSLYVPSYVVVTGRDDSFEQYSYQIREIDVADPLHPSARAAVEVPGTLACAAGAAHQVLTTDYVWDDAAQTTRSTLHLVDLSLGWKDRVLASRALDGYAETVTVSGANVHVATEDWNGEAPRAQLATFDLPALATTSTIDRDRGAYAGEVHSGFLFLRTWGWTGAMDVYSLATPAAPSFVASHDVAGLGAVTVAGGRAYVAAGLFGVESFDLSK